MKEHERRVFRKILLSLKIPLYTSFPSLMKYLFLSAILCCFSCWNAPKTTTENPKISEKEALARQTKEAFLHAWTGYKKYAWGHDALKPLSKTHKDWYAQSLVMTPLDAYDTMLMMGLTEEAKEAKALILSKLHFDHDMSVQVFEVVIRILGGLLTAHQMDGDPKFLALATDLGNRLLPAFNSPTGMPYRYVNLKSGAVSDAFNNPAEIGTLLLEFGTLSKLTGNPVYYDKAKHAFKAVYQRHSQIGLPGTILHVETGAWENRDCHISGRIDSYFEYMYKGWLLFDDPEFKDMWETTIAAVNKHLADTLSGGLWYQHVDMDNGHLLRRQFGALDAFMPALLALSGDLPRAKALQENCFKMWTNFGIEPEQIYYQKMEIIAPYYVLRPENLESACYLYHLTKDSKYLVMGKTMFESILRYCRNETAFAAIKDVRTMEQSDDMESFFLAETLKYAWLLFGEDDLDLKNVVFNTEAHPIRKTW